MLVYLILAILTDSQPLPYPFYRWNLHRAWDNPESRIKHVEEPRLEPTVVLSHGHRNASFVCLPNKSWELPVGGSHVFLICTTEHLAQWQTPVTTWMFITLIHSRLLLLLCLLYYHTISLATSSSNFSKNSHSSNRKSITNSKDVVYYNFSTYTVTPVIWPCGI